MVLPLKNIDILVYSHTPVPFIYLPPPTRSIQFWVEVTLKTKVDREISYSQKFSMVQIFAEMHSDPQKKFLRILFLWNVPVRPHPYLLIVHLGSNFYGS